MPRTIKMPTADEIRSAYVSSGPRAGTQYTKAVDKVTDFVGRATSESAEASYAAGVAAAVANRTRAKMIGAKVTNESWRSDAKTKGGAIIGARIAGAGEKQQKGYAPIHAALAGLELPDKVPDDPIGNLTRIAGRVVAASANVKRRAQGKPEVTPLG